MKTKHIILLAVLAVLLPGARLHAQIFETNYYYDNGNLKFEVGEYTTSGQTINASLISGLNTATGLAVSGTDLFVVTGSAIQEYTTSGSLVNGSLITVPTNTVTEQSSAAGIAISGTDLFTTYNAGYSYSIGEYTTSGQTINASLVSGLQYSTNGGIAVSGTNLFVIQNDVFEGNVADVIGEYTTSGATVNASLIPFSSSNGNLFGITASGTDLFIANNAHTVGEYTTSGATVNASLISIYDPHGIAVSGANVVVANYIGTGTSGGAGPGAGNGSGSIGEYTTTGGTVNDSLIVGLYGPTSIVVVGSAAAPTSVTPTTTTTTVSSGSSYAATVAPVTATGGFGSTATIAGGTASGSSNVTVAFNGTGNYANIASDVVAVSGMPNKGTGSSGQTLTDKFVLKLSFDTNAANEITGGPSSLTLLWLNPATGQWVNAILGNSDGGAGVSTETQSEMESAYNPSTDDNLSWYGVDVADGYVWAVVDHNSEFGAGNPSDTPIEAVPEPSTWGMLAAGAGLLIVLRYRKSRTQEKTS